MNLRFATIDDIPLILQFIKELAEYEKMLDQVVASEAMLHEWLFEKRVAEALIASVDNEEIGFALFFHNFSTFLGRAGIYLEDIYIRPNFRGNGYGKQIFKQIAEIAVERGCGRVEWWCLDWNKPSIEFYKSLGAVAMDEWTVFRLHGQKLIELSKKD